MRYQVVFNDSENSNKTKIYTFFGPELARLGIYPEEIIKDLHQDIATIMFTAPLFVR